MFDLLKGVQIIEISVLMNGAAVGMHLGDLGADVIKVEMRGRGDYLRDFLGQVDLGVSPPFAQLNKNKRSIELDLRSEAGREIFFDLIAESDIFIDGLRTGACDALGIGYEEQRKVNKGIIYVQHTGYGAEGPYARIPTHGQQMNAVVGGLPAQSDQNGKVSRIRGQEFMGGTEAAGAGPAVGAPMAALAAVSALHRRAVDGEGAFIDVSAADAVLATSWIGATFAFNKTRLISRVGLPEEGAASDTDAVARYQLYQTSDDRFILFCAIEPKFWKNFCNAVARPDLIGLTDEKAPVDFGRQQDELRGELIEIFRSRTQAEWVELAANHDVAMGPAHRLSDVQHDPHISVRGIIVDGTHSGGGDFTYVGYPAVIDGSTYGDVTPSPSLGQHTEEILHGLGYTSTKIGLLQESKVI